MNLSGREKATIFLSILGSDAASRVLRYLPEELADVIATSVTHLPTPTPEALGRVLDEFSGYLSISPPKSQNRLEAKIEETPKPAPPPPDTPLAALNYAPAKKLAYLFSFERPQVAAFILSRLEEEKREEVLSNLGSQKETISGQLLSLKTNSFTPQLEEKLVRMFAEKI